MIEIVDLVKTYADAGQGFQALKGVTFNVRQGEFIAVMGPSGCGKSTLLNVLGMMDRPTSGAYRFQRHQVETLSDSRRTRLRRDTIGFVFQAFNLLPRMTALQNVCLPMNYAGVPRRERLERGRELLEKVGLTGKEHNTPLQLSGGERQRVGIARALANRPAFLMADEPTGNLDSRTAAEILGLFRRLHEDGMTLMLVTHDRGVAEAAQRILHIKDGLIVREERGGAASAPGEV